MAAAEEMTGSEMPKRYWLKLHYKDVLADEKMSTISNEAWGVWLKLLCVAAKSPVPGQILMTRGKRPTSAQLAALLRTEPEKLAKIITGTLMDVGLISQTRGGVLYFRNWRKYQRRNEMLPSPVLPESDTPLDQNLASAVPQDRDKERERDREKEGEEETPFDTELFKDESTAGIVAWLDVVSECHPLTARSLLNKWRGAVEDLIGTGRSLDEIIARIRSLSKNSNPWDLTKLYQPQAKPQLKPDTEKRWWTYTCLKCGRTQSGTAANCLQCGGELERKGEQDEA